MIRLLLLASLLTIAVCLPLAHAEPRAVKPSWADVKRAELRAEVAELRAENRRLRRVLRHKPSVREAIRLAVIVYGVPHRELTAVVGCESNFNPKAKNRHSTASGAAQFLTSTFRGTPFGSEDIFSPYANVLAAGWLWKQSGWSPWVCKP